MTMRRLIFLLLLPWLAATVQAADLANERQGSFVERSDISGLTEQTFYRDGSTLPTARYLFDHDVLCMRLFYQYDESGRRIETIIDDGTSLDCDDLSGVRLRRIERVIGQPGMQVVEQSYYDPISGAEKLLCRRQARYDDSGELREEVLDDSSGNTFYHRLVIPEESCITHVDSDGRAVEVYHDPYAGTTSISDSAGLLSGVDSEEGSSEVVERRHNERNQLVWRRYKDGSTETWSYHPDGSVASYVDRRGIACHYVRDAFGRAIRSEWFDREQSPLYAVDTEYCLAGPLVCRDSRGTITFYTYDPVGRLVVQEVREGEATTISRKETHYDYRSRVDGVSWAYGPGLAHRRCHYYERDDRGEVVAIRVENERGECLAHKTFPAESSYAAEEEPSPDGSLTRCRFDGNIAVIERYDRLGRPTAQEKREGNTLLSRCRFLYEVEPPSVTVEQERLVDGYVTDVVTNQYLLDASGRVITLVEDATGQPSVTHFRYNRWGDLIELIKPDDATFSYSYDGQGRIVRRWSSRGDIDERYEYDAYGRVCAAIQSDGAVTRRLYDAAGNLLQEQLANGQIIEKQFDALSRCTELRLPDHSTISYEYDAERLLSVERRRADAAYRHHYRTFNWEGRLLSSDLINGLGTMSLDWDRQNDRPALLTTPYWQQIALLDERGNVRQLQTHDPFGTDRGFFTFDSERRLIQELHEDGRQLVEQRYSYDSLDNRMSCGDQSLHVNRHNQLVDDGDHHYHYDANGNLILKEGDGQCATFAYDSLDRLTQITIPDTYRVRYIYDPFDRRISEEESRWNDEEWEVTAVRHLLYDGLDEIGSCTAEGVVTQLRVLGAPCHGAEIGSCVAVELEDRVYAPIHDLQGSLACLVDLQGAVAESYRYDAFGNRTIIGRDGTKLATSVLDNPWGYSSKRCDRLTGFYFFGRRQYDPCTGRWISKDPIGTLDGPNRYAYVHNNPLHHVDCYGLWTLPNWLTTGTDWLAECCHTVWSRAVDTATYSSYYLVENLLPYPEQFDFCTDTARQLLGDGIFLMTGYEPTFSTCGVVGRGEADSKVRITFINGILTYHGHMVDTSQLISATHGNTNVHYIYTATSGWTWDLLRSSITRVFDYFPMQSYTLANKWRALIEEMGGPNSGGLIIHYAHSIGAVDSALAKEILSPEEQRMIRIIAIGPPRMVDEDGLESATNYVSMRDGVCLLDPVGMMRGLLSDDHNIVFLGSCLDGAPLVDHLFSSETYRAIWAALGEDFVERYGSVCD